MTYNGAVTIAKDTEQTRRRVLSIQREKCRLEGFFRTREDHTAELLSKKTVIVQIDGAAGNRIFV